MVEYTLYFTQLPIISIESSNEILDEPKTLANFIYSDESQILISKIGIELRGGSSQKFPKKTYDIEFWKDNEGSDNYNVQFGDLRSDDDWILDALYNEPLRLRSYIAHKLWLKMHTPSYLIDEPKAKAGADVNYVEMFLNGKYKGVYNLSEQVDKKQLKIKSFKNVIRGELYKGVSWGAPAFRRLPDYNNDSREWSGYEMKFPKEKDITDWSNLYQFTDFVINSSNLEFVDTIWDRFDIENYSNYFLFVNLIKARDNLGQNIYVAKYKADEPYFYVPWDLDGSFGTIWNGANNNNSKSILRNGFMERVIDLNPNDFSSAISKKWFAYRDNIFNYDELSDTITTTYNFLLENKIYERESIVYNNYTYNKGDLSYMLNWLDRRLSYLDGYFKEPTIIEEDELIPINATVYPNPATNKIYISNVSDLITKDYLLFDLTGRLIRQGYISDNYISIKNLEKGMYVVKLEQLTFKFVKK